MSWAGPPPEAEAEGAKARMLDWKRQLKEQAAGDKLDDVLEEIPRVRKDLGYLPLVTPTSQIVGTQAVINVLTGERFKSISRETAGVLKGEYGATPAPVNAELQARVLEGAEAITCRPADLIDPEFDTLTVELQTLADEKGIALRDGDQRVDDVLTYALFPQVGLRFLQHRGDAAAFEPAPGAEPAPAPEVLRLRISRIVPNPDGADGAPEPEVGQVDPGLLVQLPSEPGHHRLVGLQLAAETVDLAEVVVIGAGVATDQ